MYASIFFKKILKCLPLFPFKYEPLIFKILFFSKSEYTPVGTLTIFENFLFNSSLDIKPLIPKILLSSRIKTV